MALLPIVTGADTEILRTKTKQVPKVTKEVQKLLKDMIDTTKSVDGLGLAAPQVNSGMRLCIAKIGGKFAELINPLITWRSEEKDCAEEGCLSLPGIWKEVTRPVEIVVQYLDAKGKPQERKLQNIDARVVQHEYDHLEGILIVDYKD